MKKEIQRKRSVGVKLEQGKYEEKKKGDYKKDKIHVEKWKVKREEGRRTGIKGKERQQIWENIRGGEERRENKNNLKTSMLYSTAF